MINDMMDELVAYISDSGREGEVATSKGEYFRDAGGLFGDEDTYPMRIGAFLEWFVLDKQTGGKTLIEEYLGKMEDEERRAAFSPLEHSIRSIFEVRRVDADGLHLRDMKDGKKYRALSTGVLEMFKKGCIVEARLFPEGDRYHLSTSCIFHPEKVKKFILAEMKEAAISDDMGPLINRLSAMSLKRERYSNYDLARIYKKKEN